MSTDRALLKPAEAATRLKVSLRQVYNLIDQGVLEATRIGQKTIRVYEHSVDKAVDEGKVPCE